jgi:choline dehydrogenase-like flavoprotein
LDDAIKSTISSRFLGSWPYLCGTCRFGDDPQMSVLDRAHDIDNLYVLDASFFPSTDGINPSLTIVANSFRATDKDRSEAIG